MKPREGDLVESKEGLILDVKGLVHPPNRVVAFVRYFPDEKGERKRNGLTYGKVYSLSERYKLLKEKFPKYLVHDPVFDETLCEVSVNELRKCYNPLEKLELLRSGRILDSVESKALQLAEVLKENSNIPWGAIGISGSILVGLHEISSDIDPIVYGSGNCQKVHSTLQEMLRTPSPLFRHYRTPELKSLFDFRSKDTAMSFEEFIRTESRKAFQGKFMETDYFVRFVKDWTEIHENYGDVQYKNIGYARIKATIADDSETIFTPCRYVLENTTVINGPEPGPIAEIASFRGRFCDNARNGETVVAQGKIERVTDIRGDQEHLRLLIGNKPSDYMALT